METTSKRYMGTNENSIAFSEVLDVLQHSELEVIEKIPLEIIRKIKEKSSKEYISKPSDDIDFNISEKAKSILAVIYQDYLCDDDVEAEEFRQRLIDNEIKYQEELRKKYSSNDIFKKVETFKQNSNSSENVQMMEYKESIFKKVLNKIKMWFK